ncbi:hypothetical protein Ancab_036871 [Ancistrocladus abbreviatus]
MEEGKSPSDQRSLLINELIKGKELAKQLLNHLHPSIPLETQECLLERILSCFNQGLSMASFNFMDHFFLTHSHHSHNAHAASAPAITSPRGGNSSRYHHKVISKKRKTMPHWTKRVWIGSGSESSYVLEGPLHDGYSWRKYGQKDILGANFPRGYYRCTHRHTQGCLATKQVQKSDDDPTMVHVIYRGHHTCMKSSCHRSQPPLPPPAKSQKTQAENGQYHSQQEKPNHSQETILPNFAARPRIKTEDLLEEDQMYFPSFLFSSAVENDVMGGSSFSFPPAFISLSTSESDYFPASPSRLNANKGLNVQTSESELNEPISAPDSVTNSPTGGF